MSSDRDNESAAGKHDVVHEEKSHAEGLVQHASDDENTFDVNSDELPPGYFKSPFFLGSMMGIGLGLMAGVAGYGFAAPILMIINNDIGPV
jgi:hypothetical protein